MVNSNQSALSTDAHQRQFNQLLIEDKRLSATLSANISPYLRVRLLHRQNSVLSQLFVLSKACKTIFRPNISFDVINN